MIRKVLLLATVGAAVLTFATVAPASGAALPHGATCNLAGTASFTPGLTAKPNKTGQYSFSGNLTNCAKGTVKVAKPTTGLVSATVNATGHALGPIGVSCEAGYTSGNATIGWSTGGSSAVAFKTVSAGALTLVEGKVGTSSDTDVHTGDLAAGILAFSTTTPQNCATTGLASASFQGQTGTGNV